VKSFAWILESNVYPYLKGVGGVSRSYILPKSIGAQSAKDLAGATVWMVMRSPPRDVLFAKTHIVLVEQFEDGYQTGDFLLSVDLSKSFRAAIDYQTDRFNVSDITKDFGIGVSEMDDGAVRSLQNAVTDEIHINLRPPPDALLNVVPAPIPTGNAQGRAKRAIASVTEYLPLESIWAAKVPKQLNPFANFALHKAVKVHGRILAEELISELSRLDPTIFLGFPGGMTPHSGMENPPNRREPQVDTELVPIDVKKIYARKFVADETPPIDFSEVAGKIEKAEKAHQDMLRDIASFLEKNGVRPLQSASIDLSVEKPDGLLLFELKTSSISNILSQSAKGVFQLACYRSAILQEDRIVKSLALVLIRTESGEIDAYVQRVLSGIGINVFYYDVRLEWPARIGRFLDFVRS
jgi:hypothetical protein